MPSVRVVRPITVRVPAGGLIFAESIHERDFRMQRRRDPFHKLLFLAHGEARLWRQRSDRAEAVTPGCVAVVPRGVLHGLQDARPATVFLAAFDEAFLARLPEAAELWRAVAARPAAILRPDFGTAEQLMAMWRSALHEQNAPRPGTPARLCALGLELLAALARIAAGTGRNTAADRVAALVREVEEAFYEPWSLDRAAARAGCTRRRFSALHRELTGTSFLERLTALRLERAAELLRAGAHTVAGVAFACGFNDLSHFYRLFGRRFGKAPAHWAGGTSAPHHSRRRGTRWPDQPSRSCPER